MFYDRRICYIDYMDGETKLQNAGFVKMEVRDKQISLTFHVEKLPASYEFTREIWMYGKGKNAMLGVLDLVKGSGDYIDRYLSADNMGGGISYFDLQEIRVKLTPDKELRCVWQEVKEEAIEDNTAEEEITEEAVQNVQAEIEEVVEKELQEVSREIVQETLQNPDKMEEPLYTERERGEGISGEISKWQHLYNIYPHTCPFKDEREYLSIRPEDFVIISSGNYQLINNSFLLHGFYNYGHLILARFQKDEQDKYYIGVPGNFYEKEKQVAVMFGFESFECKTEPAGVGDFGYYMIGVEL